MRIIKTYKNIAAGLLLAGILLAAQSCERSYDDPKPEETFELKTNITIADLKALYKGTPTEILSELVVAGQVGSSDQYGNIYRTMYIQDSTGGLEVKVGKSGLYNIYKQGQTVYLRPRGLYLGAYGGMVGLGMKDPAGSYETSYIDVQTIIDRTIFPGEYPQYGEDLLKPAEITSPDQLITRYECTLVTIKGATYIGLDYASFTDDNDVRYQVDTVTTWALPAYPDNPGIAIPASYASQEFSFGGQSFVVRTSGYARFAGERVENRAPKGTAVDMTGIYTTYNGSKQLILNDVRDVVPHTGE